MLSRRSFLAISLAAPCSVLSAPGYSEEEHTPFVRVSPRDQRYLELTDGSPYIPIGLNMISPPEGARGDEAGLNAFGNWLEKLAHNGGNYIRVWLSVPFWNVEHEKCGVYDPMKARRIDRLLELCRRYQIRVKLTMEHFRSIGGGPQPWADNPLYSITHGGPATSITDFFDGEESRAQFRKKIQWYSQRYGDNPVIYGWELWNEINAVQGGDVLGWTEAMLPELHKAFPKNLAMQSLGSFDRDRSREMFYRPVSLMPGNDVAQVHRYLDPGAELAVCHGPVDILAVDAVRELRSYKPGRPIILAESGAVEPSHSGPSHLYAKDRAGIILHDILFAPFFAGAAGGGQIWHWEEYVDANNLWYHFGRFAEAVRDLDPPAEAFEPTIIEHPRLRVYLLKGKRTWLVWCRDSRNDWQSELERGEAPEVLAGVTVDLGREGSGRVYDPWSGKWTAVKLIDGKILLPDFSRSLVVRLDTQG